MLRRWRGRGHGSSCTVGGGRERSESLRFQVACDSELRHSGGRRRLEKLTDSRPGGGIVLGSDVDRNGQPANRAFNALRLEDRAIDELIGICRGVLLDGAVMESEARGILQWVEANRHVANGWPANVLYSRLRDMLIDHVLDSEEEAELVELLADITGGGMPVDRRIASLSSALPLCRPAPDVAFHDKSFCLTGKFVFGSRKQCERVIVERGGDAVGSPTQKTHFLVVGSIGSTDWIHSTHGRKIEAAVELRAADHPIRIVSEEHWARFL